MILFKQGAKWFLNCFPEMIKKLYDDAFLITSDKILSSINISLLASSFKQPVGQSTIEKSITFHGAVSTFTRFQRLQLPPPTSQQSDGLLLTKNYND